MVDLLPNGRYQTQICVSSTSGPPHYNYEATHNFCRGTIIAVQRSTITSKTLVGTVCKYFKCRRPGHLNIGRRIFYIIQESTEVPENMAPATQDSRTVTLYSEQRDSASHVEGNSQPDQGSTLPQTD